MLDFLYWSGDERFGALGVSISPHQYQPRWSGPLPTLDDVPTLQSLVDQVLRNEPVAPKLQRLIAPGGTLGGAKPKALAVIDGQSWVIKFQEPGDLFNTPLVEHNGICEVAGIGTGLLLVSRKAPEMLRYTTGMGRFKVGFPYTQWYSGTHYWGFFDYLVQNEAYVGEDYSFCHRWPHDCKGKIFAVVDREVMHVGPVPVVGRYLERLKTGKL